MHFLKFPSLLYEKKTKIKNSARFAEKHLVFLWKKVSFLIQLRTEKFLKINKEP